MGKPYDVDMPKSDFSSKEKITIVLIMFIISMLKPWKYSHEQKEFFDDVYNIMGLGAKK